MDKVPIALIALVNENTVFLNLLDDLLTKQGYEVIHCKESSAAYEFIKKEKPDLVLLDIRREHQEGGWTVLELMKLDPSTKSIPVIVTSADTEALEEQQENLRKLGYTILPKPFDLEGLLAKISEMLGNAPPGRDSGSDGDSDGENER
jgi:CheY-like chemotaxis protein